MLKLLLSNDAYVSAWVQARLDNINFRDCKAIGVMRDSRLVAGVVYHNLRDGQIEASIAVEDKRWENKSV